MGQNSVRITSRHRGVERDLTPSVEPSGQTGQKGKVTTMTSMTVNGVTTTKAPGQEQYETFTRKIGRQTKKYCQYDYRHTDGELFSCVKLTLDACRKERDEWLKGSA